MPTLVLDIDDCFAVTHEGKQDALLEKRIQTQFPGSSCWNLVFQDSENDQELHVLLHFVAAGWLPCLRMIVCQWRWKLALFSSGILARNKLVRTHLAQELKLEEKDILLFSRNDLVESKKADSCPGRCIGNRKKDLQYVGLDVEESLLVDDDPSYVVAPDQWPQLIVPSSGGYWELKYWFRESEFSMNSTTLNRFLSIPYEVLGFVAECCERTGSLRSRMKELLPAGDSNQTIVSSVEKRQQWVQKGKGLLSLT